MLHDSAQYKFAIDIDIYIVFVWSMHCRACYVSSNFNSIDVSFASGSHPNSSVSVSRSQNVAVFV